MDLIKKHYEKVLLCVVLLSLVGALVVMVFVVEDDKAKSQNMNRNFFANSSETLKELDFTSQSNLMKRLQSPSDLDFSTTNKLFNSAQWQRDVNNNLIKIQTGHEIGAEAAVVTKITPLYLVVTLDSVITNELSARYVISVERQNAASPIARRPQRFYASVGDSNPVFTLVSVSGASDSPDYLALKLADTGEKVNVSKGKPYQRVDAYSADIKYDPEGLKWSGWRVGYKLKFAGDDYNIVAIRENEVILSAQSNQKMTSLSYSP